ncbi:MAG: hypothetical protein IJW36_01000 [Clostridia bacterium]|nr:hypothetical protein [Clostridia bacterium]
MRSKKVIEIKRFDNFSENSTVKVKNYYNFLPTWCLNNTHGVAEATFPLSAKSTTEQPLKIAEAGIEVVKGVAYFKQYARLSEKNVHRLLVYGGDNKIYINQMLDDMSDLFWLYDLTANSAPITLTYKKDDLDIMIMATADEMVVWKTGYSPYKIEDVPIITSMCMHEGVLFCTVKDPAYKIWFALDLDAENVGNVSNDSNYISLDDDLGDAKKIVVFYENVYVFRDYGISKINYLKQEKTISQIYKSNTKIYANTVDISGNSILFMTKDGLYSFNGIKVAKLKVDFLSTFNVDNAGAVASSNGVKYFLALRLNFNDGKQILCETGEYVNNTLLVVDTHDFTYEIIRGIDIKSLVPVKTEVFEKVLLTFNTVHTDKIGEIVNISKCVDVGLPKFWASENLTENFSTKLFTKLTVEADKDVVFTLKHDGGVHTFKTYATGLNQFSFRICCKQVSLEIASDAESAVVKNVLLDYYEYQ